MNTKERKHFKSKGLTEAQINLLSKCLGQCKGCFCSGCCITEDVLHADDKDRIENAGGF